MLPLITGSVLWESLSVSPCPGKCLTDVKTPASLCPIIYALAFLYTLSGSSPNDLFPIIGFFELLLTSTEGEKL